MLIEPKVVTVGDFSYEITRLPARQCLPWQARIAGIVAPVLKELGRSVDPDKPINDQLSNLFGGAMSGISDVIEKVAKVDPELIIVTDLLALVTVRGGKNGDTKLVNDTGLDLHFGHGDRQAPHDDMYLLAYEVILANHFLPKKLIGALEKLAVNKEELTTTELLTNA